MWLAPVVEHQIVRMLVVVLLAPFHADHGEVGMVAALEQRLIRRPVVRVDGDDHALELGGMRHIFHRSEERVQVLRLALPAVHGEKLHISAAGRRLAHSGHVHDGEADDVASLLEEQGVAEGETVHDLHFLAQVHAAPDAVGDAAHPLHHRLLLRLLQRGVAPHGEARLGRPRRLHDLPAVERLARDHDEALGTIAELLVEHDVLRAVGIRRHALEGRAHDLAIALLGHEAAPWLHEPAVMDILRAAEDLTRSRAHLALEEVAERLLDDVAHLGEVALAHATDLDEWGTSLAVQSRPVHCRPHDWLGSPASSSSSVITPEWSSPPLPLTRSALKSSWTMAVHGRGTPKARPDSMIRPRSLK